MERFLGRVFNDPILGVSGYCTAVTVYYKGSTVLLLERINPAGTKESTWVEFDRLEEKDDINLPPFDPKGTRIG